MEDVYKENGFDNRNDYIVFLAQEYGMSFNEVFSLANLLGENEDFDGLLTALEDAHDLWDGEDEDEDLS